MLLIAATRLALVLLGNEHEAEALGLATGAGGEDDFVDRGVCGHEFLEVVLRCGERQVADVEFEAFGVLAFFPAALLLVVVSVANADAATVDAMTVEGLMAASAMAFSA